MSRANARRGLAWTILALLGLLLLASFAGLSVASGYAWWEIPAFLLGAGAIVGALGWACWELDL